MCYLGGLYLVIVCLVSCRLFTILLTISAPRSVAMYSVGFVLGIPRLFLRVDVASHCSK